MSSSRKVAANRVNGGKSRGPRTAAGKKTASRNAMRHGLSTINRSNPLVAADIARLADALCEDDSNPLLYEQALIIAENHMMLRSVRSERVAAIERLRDRTAVPYAQRDNTRHLAKARHARAELSYQELVRLIRSIDDRQLFDEVNLDEVDGLFYEYEEKLNKPYHSDGRELAKPHRPIQDRDEFAAMCWAMPDLKRLVRYDRRAWSRLRRALREFMQVKADSKEDHPMLDRSA